MIIRERMKPSAAMACARGVSIVLVVLYHADTDLYLRLRPDYTRYNFIYDTFRAVAVPIFLICAGLAMSVKAQSARRLVGEASKYVYLYVVWTAISLGLTATSVTANLTMPLGLHEWLSALLLPESPLWFPLALALMLLSAACLVRLPRAVRMGLGVCVAFLPLLPIHGFGRDFVILTCICTVFFYGGLLYRREMMLPFKARLLRTFLASAVGYAVLISVSRATGIADFPLDFAALGFIGFVALTSLWMLQPSTWLSRPFAAIGRAALPILVMHDFWMHVAEAIPLFPSINHMTEAREMLLPFYVTSFALLASYLTFRAFGRVTGVFTAPDFVPDITMAAWDACRNCLAFGRVGRRVVDRPATVETLPPR